MSGSVDYGRSMSYGSESSVAGGGYEPVLVWGNIPDGRRFIEEVHRHGEPDQRPWVDHVVLPRTAGMSAREEQFRGRALFATVMGDSLPVTPEDLLGAMEVICGVRQSTVRVEVCDPPFHFFPWFDSEEDCTSVVLASGELRCGLNWIRFKRWSIYSRGMPGKMQYKTVVSIEGLLEEAWERQAVHILIAALDGELIEMLSATDRWVLPVTAWLHDPSAVPKLLHLTVPLPAMLPAYPGSDEDVETPPPPCSSEEKRTRDYTLILHIKEVIDHGEVFAEDMDPMYYPGEDMIRRHTFKT
ncbi:unnamed protein product [Alopecurus aequalis]